jgi:3-phenylpropionate/cinnamic acid dioxygenase small subunit
MDRGLPATEASQALWFELMQFYIDEAWLLDDRKYDEWLDLFTEDMTYFMPRRKNVMRRDLDRELTKPGDLNIFEDDKDMMRVRVARLESGWAWSEDPPSRTRHIIGNLKVTPQEDGDVRARTAFLVYKSHLETNEDLFSGYRDDLLKRVDGGWKIAERTVVLDHNVLLSKNISIFF